MENDEKKDIEIVTGDDSELEISDVHEHLNLDRVRKNPEKKNIIVPGIKNKENEDEN